MESLNKNRGWQRVLGLVLPYLFIVGIFQIVGSLIIGVEISQPKLNLSTEESLTLMFFDLIGTLVVLGLFMSRVDEERFVNLGFQIKNRLNDLLFGFALGFGLILIGFFVILILGEIKLTKLSFDFKEFSLSILTFIVIAIVEEVLLRGYVLRNFMISFNKYIALILSSVIFSLLHFFNPNINAFALLELFIAGILLGISYLYTKNLWFPIGLHFSWNLVQSFLGFNVSGNDMYSIVELKLNENNIINGGAFGFEGSIFSLVFSIIIIVFIEGYFKKENRKQTDEDVFQLTDV